MKELVLPAGVSRYSVSKGEKIRILAKENAETLIEYTAEEEMDLTWEIRVFPGVRASVFFLNRSEKKTVSALEAHIAKDAELSLGYLEWGKEDADFHARVHLEEDGGSSLMRTAAMAHSKLNYDIETIHHAPHTRGIMKNYGLVTDDTPWTIVCAGRIEKHAGQSESRQETRILTFAKPETVKVLPILYIDENDVQASHANSIGQPDAEALYYMESRGLSRKEVIGLLAAGYIAPIAEVFEDPAMRAYIRKMTEKKVREWES